MVAPDLSTVKSLELDELDASDNSLSSVDTAGCSQRKDKHEDRIVQISTPGYADCILSAISLSRSDATHADGNLVVKNTIFPVHRLVVSSFSKVLDKAFSSEPSRVVYLENIEANVMSCILDWMYGNMAILKESILLSFIKAVRQLEIDNLQTPGLLELEKKLAAKGNTQSSTTELVDVKQEKTMPPSTSLSPSVSLMIDGKKTDFPGIRNTSSVKVPDVQDDCKINFIGKTLEETSEDKKTHCCCCYKKASEKTRGKEKEATKEDDIKQSLVRKLEKCGTQIVGAGTGFLGEVPAWLFSSKALSITPIKESLKVSTPKEGTPPSLESKSLEPSPSAVHDNDDPIIIGSGPSKPPLQRVRRHLQFLQASRHQQQYNHYNERGRKHVGGNPINNTRTNSYPASSSASNRGFRRGGGVGQTQQRLVHKTISSSNDAPGAQKLYDQKTSRNCNMVSRVPQSRPQSTPITPPYVGRGGSYKRRSRPRISPGCGSGSLVHEGDRNTLGVQQFKSPVKSQPPAQYISENNVYGNGKEHIAIINTGIPVTVLGDDTLIISDLNSMQFPLDLENDAQLDNSEYATNYLENSEDTAEVVPTQLEHQSEKPPPSSLQLECYTRPRDEMSKSSNTESDRISDDSNNPSGLCLDKGVAFEGFDKTENNIDRSSNTLPLEKKIKETSSSHTSSKGNEDLSEKESMKPVTCSVNIKGPDADKATQLKSSKKQKSWKQKFRPKKKHLCTVCRRIFRTSASLTMHMRTHTRERPFYCSSCDYRTDLHNKIKSHVSKKHRRKLVTSEMKRHNVPLVDPRQASGRPAKRKKDIDKKEVKMDSEVSNKEKGKECHIQSESPQSVSGMDEGSLQNEKQRKSYKKDGELKEKTDVKGIQDISNDKATGDDGEMTNEVENN